MYIVLDTEKPYIMLIMMSMDQMIDKTICYLDRGKEALNHCYPYLMKL